MVKKTGKVIIDNEAKLQLREAYRYITANSLQNAEKVKNKILASIKDLTKNPEQHPADKYRKNNDKSFRAYELYNYRITYHISAEQITVIRIRHTKMNPLEY